MPADSRLGWARVKTGAGLALAGVSDALSVVLTCHIYTPLTAAAAAVVIPPNGKRGQ